MVYEVCLSNISFRKNIISSYASQFYVVFSGIVVLPFYISWLGAESYGLVGFFAMLQAIFSLLDLGLTPTISRETSRYNAGKLSSLEFIRVYRAMAIIFIVFSFCGGFLLFILSEPIALKWLDINTLSEKEVVFSIQVMAVCIALRWLCGLYRGVIQGFELIIWLSKFNVFISTLRFIAVFPVMYFFGADINVFFIHQLLTAVVEFSVIFFKAKSKISSVKVKHVDKVGWKIQAIKPYISFSLSIALSSGLWIVVTQSDKLLMSKLLSLEEYGYFTLAVLVANGIMMLSSPLSLSLMPRLAYLAAANNKSDFLRVYSSSTRIISVISSSLGLVFFFFPREIIFIWTGDMELADSTGHLLKYYAAGYAFLSLSAFPYYLQYALGSMKLHVLGTILYLLILLPLMLVFVDCYGSVGAGYAWLFINLLYFLFWTAFVHSRFIKGEHFKWFINDIVLIVLPSFCIVFFARDMFAASGRIESFFYISGLFSIILIFSFLWSKSSILSKFR